LSTYVFFLNSFFASLLPSVALMYIHCKHKCFHPVGNSSSATVELKGNWITQQIVHQTSEYMVYEVSECTLYFHVHSRCYKVKVQSELCVK
jgi:hypothetical protein